LADELFDIGFELLAEELKEDVFLDAAGIVCRGMDGHAVEEVCIFGRAFKKRSEVLL
jgi:hypothetical protein